MHQDAIEQTLALGGGYELGIAHAGNVTIRIEDDRRGDDRAREAAAPDLVDSRDVHESDAAQRVLQRAHRGDTSHKVRWSG